MFHISEETTLLLKATMPDAIYKVQTHRGIQRGSAHHCGHCLFIAQSSSFLPAQSRLLNSLSRLTHGVSASDIIIGGHLRLLFHCVVLALPNSPFSVLYEENIPPSTWYLELFSDLLWVKLGVKTLQISDWLTKHGIPPNILLFFKPPSYSSDCRYSIHWQILSSVYCDKKPNREWKMPFLQYSTLLLCLSCWRWNYDSSLQCHQLHQGSNCSGKGMRYPVTKSKQNCVKPVQCSGNATYEDAQEGNLCGWCFPRLCQKGMYMWQMTRA